MNSEGRSRGLILKYYPNICLVGLGESMKYLSEHSCCSGLDSKRSPPVGILAVLANLPSNLHLPIPQVYKRGVVSFLHQIFQLCIKRIWRWSTSIGCASYLAMKYVLMLWWRATVHYVGRWTGAGCALRSCEVALQHLVRRFTNRLPVGRCWNQVMAVLSRYPWNN
jgi:hypothetical protein